MAKRKRKQQQIKKQKEENNKTKGKGLFPNRYFQTSLWRDTVNQASYHAPKLIKKVSNELNTIAKQRIDQFISQAGKEVNAFYQKLYMTQWRIYIKHLSSH